MTLGVVQRSYRSLKTFPHMDFRRHEVALSAAQHAYSDPLLKLIERFDLRRIRNSRCIIADDVHRREVFWKLG